MSTITTLLEKIQQADAILVGTDSGMSAATGLNFWYEDSDLYNATMRYYADKYGFNGMFEGFYTHYHTEEEQWGYYLGALDMILNLEAPKPTYAYLKHLLGDKPFHIVTTNQDTVAFRYFPEAVISEIQGSWHYFQSQHTYSDETLYSTKIFLQELLPKLEAHKLPSQYIPKSKVDGSPLIPWARGPEFLEGDRYFKEHQKISCFLGKHRGQKILFIELGVGRMTPMFIQEPFWEMTNYMPDSFYVNINPKDALTHQQIAERSLLIHDDINTILEEAVNQMEDSK